MPDNRNRKRPIRFKFFVDEKELKTEVEDLQQQTHKQEQQAGI